MSFLLASEPQLGRDLQVEIVIDVASRDYVGFEVFLSSRHNRSWNVMPKHFLFFWG